MMSSRDRFFPDRSCRSDRTASLLVRGCLFRSSRTRKKPLLFVDKGFLRFRSLCIFLTNTVRRFSSSSMVSRTAVLVLFAVCLSCFGGTALAQPSLPDPPDPNESPTSDTADADWSTELNGKFSASQAAYKNWQEGGLNSLAFTTMLDGATERKGEHWAQGHTMRLVLGFIDQEERRIWKSEDLIRLQTGLQYQGDGFFKRFNPTLAGDLRTQFASGFNYSSNPYPDGHPRDGEETPVQTSAFFAPGTLTESLGLTYEPYSALSIRFGIASKQTIVRTRDFRVLYGVEEDDLMRVEGGAQLATSLDQRLAENIRYRSQLDVFLAINQLGTPPDVILENVINMQVNSWLSTDLEFAAVYDEDTTSAIQLKEVISVGVSFSIL